MTPLREEAELPTEATPVVKPRLFSVIALSMALGAILALFLVYFYFGSQRMAALQNEVSLAHNALKEKNKSIDDMRRQIEALSLQIDALKEYSIARSAASQESKTEPMPPVAGVEAAKHESNTTGKGRASKSGTSKPGPVNRTKASSGTSSADPDSSTNSPNAAALDCDLVGKSPKEQEATMKRCVDLSNTGDGEQ